MRFDNQTNKQVATKMAMDELSGVTTGAHAGALVGIIKTGDEDEMRKNLFLQAVAHIEATDEIYDIIWKVWDYTDALYDASMEIIRNVGEYPDPGAAFAEILKSFGTVVSSLKKNASDEVAKSELRKLTKSSNLKVLNIIKDSKLAVSATTKSKEEIMKTPEEIAAEQLAKDSKMQKQIQTLTVQAAMTDTQKAHYATLDDAGQKGFLELDSAKMDETIKNATAEDPIVYTAKSGDVFRQSDDTRLVNAIKTADATTTENEKMAKAAEVTRLAKSAEIELGNLPGELKDKVTLLKAVETITNVEDKAAVMQILAAQNAGMHKALKVQGTQSVNEEVGTANAELDKMAKGIQEKDSVTYATAYSKALDTPEGAKLYEQMHIQ